MRYKLIACKALFREFSLLTANCEHFVDATFLRQKYHDTPELLQKTVQEQIDKIDEMNDPFSQQPRLGLDFDAIIIGYGLCSNAVLNLSSKKYPIVLPRTDDCIGLLLGSYTRYKELFEEKPGTYWYTPSWIENAYVPSEEYDRALMEEYTQKYGAENAEYVLSMEQSIEHYTDFSYIEWKRLNFPHHKKFAQEAAKHYSKNFNEFLGEESFLSDLLNGNWDERFLVVPPGQKVIPDYSGILIDAEEK